MAPRPIDFSIALFGNERTRPIIEGRVVPEGMRLFVTDIHPSEMFWRQLHFGDFDISEMSLSSLLIATSRGDTRWQAIPVFSMRKFFHTGILIRTDAGIEKPADLAGKRVGVPEYQQTAAIWTRGILEHEFKVQARDIEWHMERGPDHSHGSATGFTPPEGVRLNQIPPTTNIGKMLVSGKLDATLLYLTDPNLVDRSRIDLDQVPEVRPLFKDPEAENHRYYAKTGIYPINHTLVVKRSILEKHPWIALNLFSAFVEAKTESERRLEESLRPYLETGLIDRSARDALGKDPKAYGLKATRTVLETVAQYVHEQGLTDRQVGIEEIFAPSTLNL